MAIGLIYDFKGVTLDQYDEVIEKMDLGGRSAPGSLFHWAAATDDGLRVVDVWEDRAQFDRFAEEKIGPLTAEVGITEPPEIAEFEIHSYLEAPNRR
jgi:hypothetical protein